MQQLTNSGSTMRTYGSYKKTLLLVAISLSSAGLICSCAPKSLVRQAKESRDQQQAEAQLKTEMDGRTLQQNWSATQQRQTAQQNARDVVTTLENDKGVAAQPIDPSLVKAATPRHWAPVPVTGFNINAVFNSTWQDGYLNYRVALLGDRAAINEFLGAYTKYGILMVNQGGYNVLVFPVSPQGFSFEPDGYNQGIPTADTSGRVECSLEQYQQSVQWNMSWGI
jgi:hypothetical protein